MCMHVCVFIRHGSDELLTQLTIDVLAPMPRMATPNPM